MSEIPKLVFEDESKKLVFADLHPKLVFDIIQIPAVGIGTMIIESTFIIG